MEGTPVGVRLRGRELRGVGEILEGEAALEGLTTILRQVASYRRYYGVELGEDGRARNPTDVKRIAEKQAVVRIGGLTPAKGAGGA